MYITFSIKYLEKVVILNHDLLFKEKNCLPCNNVCK